MHVGEFYFTYILFMRTNDREISTVVLAVDPRMTIDPFIVRDEVL